MVLRFEAKKEKETLFCSYNNQYNLAKFDVKNQPPVFTTYKT